MCANLSAFQRSGKISAWHRTVFGRFAIETADTTWAVGMAAGAGKQVTELVVINL